MNKSVLICSIKRRLEEIGHKKIKSGKEEFYRFYKGIKKTSLFLVMEY